MYLRSYEDLSHDDRRRLLAEIESEMSIVDSDLKRALRKKEELSLEKRRLDEQAIVIRVRSEEVAKEMKKIEKEEFYFRNEIDQLKKKRNSVTR